MLKSNEFPQKSIFNKRFPLFFSPEIGVTGMVLNENAYLSMSYNYEQG